MNHLLFISSLWGDALSYIVHNGHVHGQANLQSLLGLTLETLEIAAVGIAVSVLIAIPVGVWLGHIHRGSFVAINLGNVWRALPSLAVLAIGMSVLGLGFWTLELALVVLAVPPILTNAYVAVDQVERDIVDAARGMGLTGWQILRQVELPLAVPLVFAGIRTSALFVVSSATIASLIGFNGSLGDIISNNSLAALGYPIIGASLCVALLALFVDGALAALQRGLTPRGLKDSHAQPTRLEEVPVGT